MRELVVLKLGGSVITVKNRASTLREDVILRLGSEISDVKQSLILVHGGGSYAHPVAKRFSVSEGYKSGRHLEGFIEISKAVRRLNLEVVERLVEGGLKCIGIPSSTIFSTRSGEIVTCSLDSIFLSLRIGIVPVLCGDAVLDGDLGFTVLSGDTIASYLARRLRAKRLIYAVDVDGVYVRDRVTDEVKVVEELRPGMRIEPMGGVVEDVTGGIMGKIEEGFKAAEEGVEVLIVNGLVEGRIRTALLGEKVIGTRLKP